MTVQHRGNAAQRPDNPTRKRFPTAFLLCSILPDESQAHQVGGPVRRADRHRRCGPGRFRPAARGRTPAARRAGSRRRSRAASGARRAQPRRTRPRPAAYDWVPVLRKRRADGWSPQKQRDFVEALADTGLVEESARVVGMSVASCYRLRRAPGAESFARAWDAALDFGALRLKDIAMDRAMTGQLVPQREAAKLTEPKALPASASVERAPEPVIHPKRLPDKPRRTTGTSPGRADRSAPTNPAPPNRRSTRTQSKTPRPDLPAESGKPGRVIRSRRAAPPAPPAPAATRRAGPRTLRRSADAPSRSESRPAPPPPAPRPA